MGTVTRFSEEKQPELWLDTAEAVAAHRPDTHLVAFGDGVMLAELREKAARSRFADRIHLPGLTRDPWTALSTMDVFVLTSRLEGLPNVLVEAQAMGVPVVTTGRGGMTETYIEGKTGLTASTATAEELAAAVLDILGDPDRRGQMSVAAWDHARDEFSLDQMVSRTLSVFDRATNSQPH
jgi:glycosyltransferase involved in cell wall biosynthesis